MIEEDEFINYQVAYDEISEAVINHYYGFNVFVAALEEVITTIRIEGKHHPEWRVLPKLPN